MTYVTLRYHPPSPTVRDTAPLTFTLISCGSDKTHAASRQVAVQLVLRVVEVLLVLGARGQPRQDAPTDLCAAAPRRVPALREARRLRASYPPVQLQPGGAEAAVLLRVVDVDRPGLVLLDEQQVDLLVANKVQGGPSCERW